ncbi:hypothetical protein [Pseudomonas sp.]|uniref:hypothetical protein n=1 Tax=Pseudomonas sp. TaxID=306 RepID=UPI0026135CB7|nr:hypothetical protein [Pseudomonas sp.]
MEKLNELIELCISLSDIKANNYYNLDIIPQGDSIVVYKIVANDVEDMDVSSLCNEGAENLINWVHEKEHRDAE